MDLENLTAKFKTIYDIDLTTGENQIYLAQAIRTISVEYPKEMQDSVDSIKGQSRYTVSPQSLIKVNHVYYNRKVGNVSGNDIGVYGFPMPQRASYYRNIDRYCDIHEERLYDDLNPYNGVILSHDTFDVLPAPNADGIKIYYDYDAYRSLAEIPDIFEECLFDLFNFYSREGEYQKNKAKNNGNSFYFDRRGMGTNKQLSDGEYQDVHGDEIKNITNKIRLIAMKLGS